jgi:hypothetical protein
MQFTKLVPELYYGDIREGLKMFVDCLGFIVTHSELHSGNPFCVVEKDTLSVMLFENKELAEQYTPLLRLVTHNIDDAYQKIATKFPELLHPNLSQVTLRPWGAREFALLDGQIGIVIQQW